MTTGRRRYRWAACGIVACLAAVVASAGPPAHDAAHAATMRTVARWTMDEPSGSTVLVDSGPNAIHGVIGPNVLLGQRKDGATYHRFAFRLPNQLPVEPERLDIVPHDPRLDPGTRPFAVTVRLWTTQNFGNIVQKGQSGAPGGYWKFEAPKGRVTCLFRGSLGSVAVKSAGVINDGRWHTIRCERTAAGVSMTVDGSSVTRRSAQPGAIANSRPISIAGKRVCDQVDITCDYFVGGIDEIRIEAG